MFRLERFLQRHVAEENFNRGIPAVEERRAMFAGFIAADREAVGSLELDPAIEAPAYHAQTERSEEHTSELQSLMRISYAVFCLKKKKKQINSYYTSISKRR